MKKLWSYILTLAVCVLAFPQGVQAGKSWESLRQERISEGRVVTRTSDIEVCTLPGIIMVSTTKPVQVKVFSILGQLVSSETIPAGLSQLNLGTHGLFIVKVDNEITCKVAL